MTELQIAELIWKHMDAQEWDALSGYFAPEAVVLWPNTNERFDVNGFVRANREYPGRWRIQVQRAAACGGGVVTVVRVQADEGDVSLHAVSFFEIQAGKITRLEEYWGEDGPAPAWRQAMEIAEPIENGPQR